MSCFGNQKEVKKHRGCSRSCTYTLSTPMGSKLNYGQRYPRYRTILNISIPGHRIWSSKKVLEIGNLLTFCNRGWGSELCLLSFYRKHFWDTGRFSKRSNNDYTRKQQVLFLFSHQNGRHCLTEHISLDDMYKRRYTYTQMVFKNLR